MLTLKQKLEIPKGIHSEIKSLFQIHVVQITLVDLDINYKVAHKHNPHLCKLFEIMHKYKQVWTKSTSHTNVHSSFLLTNL
jgi:hypothetical protein